MQHMERVMETTFGNAKMNTSTKCIFNKQLLVSHIFLIYAPHYAGA